MTSAKAKKSKKSSQGNLGIAQGVTIANIQPNSAPAVKPKTLDEKDLNSFLALHVSEATDTYLRGLAMLSCELAYTVKELREKQKASLQKELDAAKPVKAPAPVAQKTLKKEVDDIKPKKTPVRKTSKKKLDGTGAEVLSRVTQIDVSSLRKPWW